MNYQGTVVIIYVFVPDYRATKFSTDFPARRLILYSILSVTPMIMPSGTDINIGYGGAFSTYIYDK